MELRMQGVGVGEGLHVLSFEGVGQWRRERKGIDAKMAQTLRARTEEEAEEEVSRIRSQQSVLIGLWELNK